MDSEGEKRAMEGYRKSVSTPHRTQEACDIFPAFPPKDARHLPPTATPFQGAFPHPAIVLIPSFLFPTTVKHQLRPRRSPPLR